MREPNLPDPFGNRVTDQLRQNRNGRSRGSRLNIAAMEKLTRHTGTAAGWMRPLIAVAAAIGLAGTALAAPKTDVIVLVNGDRLTGEVKGLERGKLSFKTDATGTIQVEWNKVASLWSDQYLQVELTSGLRYAGRAPQHDQEGQLLIRLSEDSKGWELPLADVVYDFYDKLKSITQGYGSFDYEVIDYRETDLVKLDILINGERVDALSQLVHQERAVERGRMACERLKDEIPRQMFKIAIQGAIGAKMDLASYNAASLLVDCIGLATSIPFLLR
jgi:hypothetical protein